MWGVPTPRLEEALPAIGQGTREKPSMDANVKKFCREFYAAREASGAVFTRKVDGGLRTTRRVISSTGAWSISET